MAGVTPNGFEPKTYEEIINDVSTRAKLEEFFGTDFPTSSDSAFGILAGVFGGSIIDLWNQAQAVADNQNRDYAEGVYLDYLAGLVGISRLPASGSTGALLFEGGQNTFVPAFFAVSDTQGRVVLTQNDLTLNRSECYNSTFSIKQVIVGESYTVIVESDTYTYIAQSLDTAEDIIDALVSSIGAQTTYTATKDEDANLLITYNTFNNLLTTTNSDVINLDAIGGVVLGQAVDVGPLSFPANSITRLVSINLDINSVTNPQEFIEGRFRESDEELRDRIEEREQATGTATKPSIETTIAQVAGVTNVLVVENDTMVTDPNGIPPKSYETFVVGGSDSDIGNAIWETKPAAIQTYGDIAVVVEDQNGDPQTVEFSRKDQKYAWLRAEYELTGEGDFPANGETLMKESVVAEGELLVSGEDYDPNRFYAPLYSSVDGRSIRVNSIEIAVTNVPTDTPAYQSTYIPVAETENLNFDVVRVILTTPP